MSNGDEMILGLANQLDMTSDHIADLAAQARALAKQEPPPDPDPGTDPEPEPEPKGQRLFPIALLGDHEWPVNPLRIADPVDAPDDIFVVRKADIAAGRFGRFRFSPAKGKILPGTELVARLLANTTQPTEAAQMAIVIGQGGVDLREFPLQVKYAGNSQIYTARMPADELSDLDAGDVLEGELKFLTDAPDAEKYRVDALELWVEHDGSKLDVQPEPEPEPEPGAQAPHRYIYCREGWASELNPVRNSLIRIFYLSPASIFGSKMTTQIDYTRLGRYFDSTVIPRMRSVGYDGIHCDVESVGGVKAHTVGWGWSDNLGAGEIRKAVPKLVEFLNWQRKKLNDAGLKNKQLKVYDLPEQPDPNATSDNALGQLAKLWQELRPVHDAADMLGFRAYYHTNHNWKKFLDANKKWIEVHQGVFGTKSKLYPTAWVLTRGNLRLLTKKELGEYLDVYRQNGCAGVEWWYTYRDDERSMWPDIIDYMRKNKLA